MTGTPGRRLDERPKWIGVGLLVFVGVALPTVIASTQLRELQRRHLGALTRLSADHVASRVEAELKLRVSLVEGLAHGLARGWYGEGEGFRMRARARTDGFADFQRIDRLDAHGRAAAVVPSRRVDRGRNVRDHTATQVPFEEALSTSLSRLSRPYALEDGERGITVISPLPDRSEGALSATFRLDTLLGALFPEARDEELAVTVDGPGFAPEASRHVEVRRLELFGRELHVSVAPSAEQHAHAERGADLLLVFGLSFACLAAGMAFELSRNRKRLREQEGHRRVLLSSVQDHLLRVSSQLVVLAHHASDNGPRLPERRDGAAWMPHPLQRSVQDTLASGRARDLEVDIADRHYEARVSPDPDGTAVLRLRDMTDQRELENERLLLSRLVESSVHLACVLGPTDEVEYLNPTGLAMLGLPQRPERLDGFIDLGGEAHPKEWRGTWSGRVMARDASGTEFPIHLTSFSITTERGLRLGLIAVDLRQTVELESQLRQAHKMESIGVIAAGVAHDFNNAVTVFRTGLDLLGEAEGLPSDCSEDLELLRSAAVSAGQVAHQILALARPAGPGSHKVAIEVDVALAASARMLTKAIRDDIELQWNLRARRVEIRGDAGSLQQVVLNLVINARDAIPDTGRIAIRTRFDETLGRLRLEVEDDGPGIPETLRERIFEPFYSTKDRGRGTGLGLSMVRQTIESWGGRVEAQAGAAGGTMIAIEVPARRKTLAANEDAPITAPSRASAARVVLVDDEPTLRTVLERALGRAGYDVETASDGLEALSLIGEHTDVLVTDLIMPRMGGLELARRVRRAHPQVRVLLLSGHPEVSEQLEGVGAEWVSKPLDARTIVARIQDTLARRAS